MATILLNGLVMGLALASGRGADVSVAQDCCAANLACCNPPSACCATADKLDCCAAGLECCDENRACCSGPQACCFEGAECCLEQRACCGDGGAAKTAVSTKSACCQATAKTVAVSQPAKATRACCQSGK